MSRFIDPLVGRSAHRPGSAGILAGVDVKSTRRQGCRRSQGRKCEMRSRKNVSAPESIVYAEDASAGEQNLKSRIEKMNSSVMLDLAEKGLKVRHQLKSTERTTNYANDYDTNS